jgi:transcriptional regulator with XRE-family HTH domain
MLGKPDTDDLAVAFGRVLRQYRLSAGLSQEKLALEAGLQRNYISLLELGQNQPTITTLFKLAVVLDIEPEQIVEAVRIEAEAEQSP